MWKPVYHPGPWKAFLDRKDNKGLSLMEVKRKYLKEQLDYETLHPPTVNFNSPKGLSPEELEEHLKGRLPGGEFSCNPTGPTLLSYQSDFSTIDGWTNGVSQFSTVETNQTLGGISPAFKITVVANSAKGADISIHRPLQSNTEYLGSVYDFSCKVYKSSGIGTLGENEFYLNAGQLGIGSTFIDLGAQLNGKPNEEWIAVTGSGTIGTGAILGIQGRNLEIGEFIGISQMCFNVYDPNFVCEVANPSINGQPEEAIGTPAIDNVNVDEGTVLSVTPANFVAGTNSYSVDIIAPSEYPNAGDIITCVVDDVYVGPAVKV